MKSHKYDTHTTIVNLYFAGKDDWDRPVYMVDTTGLFVKDVEMGQSNKPVLCWSYPKNDFHGEPDYPFQVKKGAMISIHGLQIDIQNHQPLTATQMEAMEALKNWGFDTVNESFRYSMLLRLSRDCDAYLDNNKNYEMFLWAGNEDDQIAIMKHLYNSFSDNEKPTWISLDRINEYKQRFEQNEKLSMEKAIREVEELFYATPDGQVIDSDTILEHLLHTHDYDSSGISLDIFKIWRESNDKKVVEKMFQTFTGLSFGDFLQKCKEETTRLSNHQNLDTKIGHLLKDKQSSCVNDTYKDLDRTPYERSGGAL